MKNLITTLKNIWKIEELRSRILVTLGFILIYRLGAQVPLPGIDARVLSAA
ncbi:MAG: preprotein translocase subunit SecY, partial [Flavobacteriales bacterium]|nr:preprotein translocase subunit SecY [Flavobacteriales bacterium]